MPFSFMAAITVHMILETKKIKSVTASTFSPFICHDVMGPDAMIFVFGMLNFKLAFSLSSFILPGGSDDKESACNAGDPGSIPRLGRSPGGEHGNSLHCSCLEKSQGQRSLEDYSPWGG